MGGGGEKSRLARAQTALPLRICERRAGERWADVTLLWSSLREHHGPLIFQTLPGVRSCRGCARSSCGWLAHSSTLIFLAGFPAPLRFCKTKKVASKLSQV